MYTPDVVVGHSPCDDGSMAMMVVAKYIADNNLPEPEYLPGDYANVDVEYWREKTRDKHVIVADFSFKNPVKGAIEAACKSMLILDHHATAKEVLKNEAFEDVTLENCEGLLDEHKIVALFDMERCGSRMTWEFFYPNEELPVLLEWVDYQDRAVKGKPRAADFTYWLRSRPELYRENRDNYDFLFSLEDSSDFEQAFEDGAQIAKYHLAIAGDCAKTIRFAEMVEAGETLRIGYTVASYALASTVANIVAQSDRADVGAVFYQGENAERPYGISLRSNGTGQARALAEKLGGGGHPDAAGVNMTVTEYLTLLASFNQVDEEDDSEHEFNE